MCALFPQKEAKTHSSAVCGGDFWSENQNDNMKINVKTLKGTHFEIQVNLQDTVNINNKNAIILLINSIF